MAQMICLFNLPFYSPKTYYSSCVKSVKKTVDQLYSQLLSDEDNINSDLPHPSQVLYFLSVKKERCSYFLFLIFKWYLFMLLFHPIFRVVKSMDKLKGINKVAIKSFWLYFLIQVKSLVSMTHHYYLKQKCLQQKFIKLGQVSFCLQLQYVLHCEICLLIKLQMAKYLDSMIFLRLIPVLIILTEVLTELSIYNYKMAWVHQPSIR